MFTASEELVVVVAAQCKATGEHFAEQARDNKHKTQAKKRSENDDNIVNVCGNLVKL